MMKGELLYLPVNQVELAKEVIKDEIVFDTSNPPYSKMKFEICK